MASIRFRDLGGVNHFHLDVGFDRGVGYVVDWGLGVLFDCSVFEHCRIPCSVPSDLPQGARAFLCHSVLVFFLTRVRHPGRFPFGEPAVPALRAEGVLQGALKR